MNAKQHSNSLGFTLMELMIALSIVAILTALALPSYQHQVRQARRADGQAALMGIAVEQERFRANCTRYANTLDGARNCDADASPAYVLGLDASSPESHYSLSLSGVSATAFTASATPIGDQGRDRSGGVACNPLTIDQDGERRPEECW